MSAVVAAFAIGLALVMLRARPDERARLNAILPSRRSGATENPMQGKAFALLHGLAAIVLSRRRHRRTVAAAEAATVEAVFALAAELRSGQPPARALATVASQSGVLAQPLQSAAAAVVAGVPAGDELRRLAQRPGCSGFAGVGAAWDVTSSIGGPVADVLDRLGEVLDAEQQARSALAAAMAGSRATMALLASLPAFGLVMGQALGAHPVHMLLHQPLGWMLLTAAGVMDTVGVVWTSVIMRRALR